MLANLATYYAQRIPAAVTYRLYDRTKDPGTLDRAVAFERSAIAAWGRMAVTADGVYADDLRMGARSRDLCGNWRDELVALEKGLAKLEAQRKQISIEPGASVTPVPQYEEFGAETKRPVVVHRPVVTAPAARPLTIAAEVKAPSGIKWVRVRFRRVDQTQDYETLEMKAVDDKGNFEAVIPAEKIDARFDFMYFIEAMDRERHGVIYPDFQERTPYCVVRLER